MTQALYFCTVECDVADYAHYGLAVPLYTHFTSPIRRYADVLVHRLLAAALDIASLPNAMTDTGRVGRQCETMNRKNRNAQLASRASAEFYTYQFFRGKGEEAVVMKVSAAGVHLMIPSYGVEGLLSEEGVAGGVRCRPEKEEAELGQGG